MLKILLKKQLTEIFRSYFYDAKKNKARSKGVTIAYIVMFAAIMVGILGGMFTFLSYTLCGAMAAADMEWLYFALMGLLAVLLGVFGSVFNTYAGLYLAKDNDLLLSMPIPVNVIMVSRLLGVYLMGLLYSGVVIIPAVAVYLVIVAANIGTIIGSLLLILLISVFVLTLSCALGWVVAKISLKLKNKSFVTVLISVLFLGGYYFFYFKAQTLIGDLIANATVYGAKIKGVAYPLYLFGRVGVGDIAAILIVSAVVLILFGLMWTLISRSFLNIATASGRTEKKIYRETAAKKRSIGTALLGKEFGRFTASPNYMLNCGLGILLLPVSGIALLWKGGDIVAMLNLVFSGRPGTIPVLFCAAVCTLAAMNDMAAPSVSLEGKTLWLVQSLPVTPWQVLRAKLSMQLLLTGIPTLFCLICIAIIYPFTPVEWLLLALVLLLYVLLSALLGLYLGLKMPNLTWTNEITPIKQSVGVLLAMFSGFLYTALLCVGYMLLNGWKLGFAGYMGCFAVLTFALCAVLYLWMKKKGTAIFAGL